jgi:ATP-dependent helicase/nuclease subunit B
LRHIGRDPGTVLIWPSVPQSYPQDEERRRLTREALRPAQTTDQWRHIANFAPEILDGVLRVDCSGAREEAATIALMMRDALEHPGKTCALVTPDRGLARRVATELRRWEIEIDDSAGIPLHDTAPAIYLRLVVRAVQEQFAPVPLLELLKHPLSAAGLPPEQFRVPVRGWTACRWRWMAGAMRRLIASPRPGRITRPRGSNVFAMIMRDFPI